MMKFANIKILKNFVTCLDSKKIRQKQNNFFSCLFLKISSKFYIFYTKNYFVRFLYKLILTENKFF